MNIFFLDESPYTSARMMTDKHVVKMVLESAQLLSTAHHVLDDDTPYKDILYKKTHVNHPSAIWTRESRDNYIWLYKHFVALAQEYTHRFGKIHKTFKDLDYALSHTPMRIENKGITPIRLAITNTAYHDYDAVKSYRAYYIGEKLKLDKDILRFDYYLQQQIKGEVRWKKK